jgi:hypothetical protein
MNDYIAGHPIREIGLLFYLCRIGGPKGILQLKNIKYDIRSLGHLQTMVDDIQKRDFERWVECYELKALEVMGVRFQGDIIIGRKPIKHKFA